MRALAAALVLVALAAAARPTADVADALARVKDRSTLDIITIGRKTGKRHTRPIWFVVDDGHLVVQAGRDGKTDWYQNLKKNPDVTARAGDYAFRTHATLVTDPAEVERIHKLFLAKYTSAWLLSFVGSSIGRGLPVELTPESVSR